MSASVQLQDVSLSYLDIVKLTTQIESLRHLSTLVINSACRGALDCPTLCSC